MNVLYEVNTTTQMDAVYVYGPTGRIAKKVNDIAEYYHTDPLGSTRLITTESGVKTEEIQYEPFGGEINTPEERYTYNGKEKDETGLYYYGARYYDPTIGRFFSRDPLTGKKEAPQTLNQYVYCLNNPLAYVDPTGAEGVTAQDKVEDVFKRLQSVDLDQLAAIQEALDNGTITLLDALTRILDLLGIEHRTEEGNLQIRIDNSKWYTVSLVEDLRDERGRPCYATTDNTKRTMSFNLGISKVGDLTLTVLHEACHVVLGAQNYGEGEIEHKFIYGVEVSYMYALSALGVTFSDRFKENIENWSMWYDPNGIHRVSVIAIKEKWLRWKKWKTSRA